MSPTDHVERQICNMLDKAGETAHPRIAVAARDAYGYVVRYSETHGAILVYWADGRPEMLHTGLQQRFVDKHERRLGQVYGEDRVGRTTLELLIGGRLRVVQALTVSEPS